MRIDRPNMLLSKHFICIAVSIDEYRVILLNDQIEKNSHFGTRLVLFHFTFDS